MPWFCDNCAGRMLGRLCKCGVDAGATRVPPLDGLLFFNETEDNQGTPRYELMKQREQQVFAPRQIGKTQAVRALLSSWLLAWEGGYRGPMPYVIGPGWRPQHTVPRLIIDD